MYKASNSNQSRACGGSASAVPFYTTQPMMGSQMIGQPYMTSQPMMGSQTMTQPYMTSQPMMGSQTMTQPYMTSQPMMTNQIMGQPVMTSQPMMSSQMMGQPVTTSQPMMSSQMMGQPVTTSQPVMTTQSMFQSPVAQATNDPLNLNLGQSSYSQLGNNYQNTMNPMQAMPVANYPAYTTTQDCNGQTMSMPNQVAVTQTSQTAPVTQSQSTTTHHKKTTYVESYTEPTWNMTSDMTQQYPLTDNMNYTVQQQPKNSTMQDYNLYLLEKEYYGDDTEQPVYTKTVSYRDNRGDMPQTISCNNIPLATTCVRIQPYQNLNDSNRTLQQGTAFSDLYMPYTPKKVTVRGGNQYE
jgi:hypothetical protein